RRRHTSFSRDWSSDVCSSDLLSLLGRGAGGEGQRTRAAPGIRLDTSLQARSSPPFVKGDIGGFGQIKFVLTDILIGVYSHAANIPQHATLLMPNLSECSAEIPPRPPLRKGGLSLLWLMTWAYVDSSSPPLPPLPSWERGMVCCPQILEIIQHQFIVISERIVHLAVAYLVFPLLQICGSDQP